MPFPGIDEPFLEFDSPFLGIDVGEGTLAGFAMQNSGFQSRAFTQLNPVGTSA
jgi:hypothetical protein